MIKQNSSRNLASRSCADHFSVLVLLAGLLATTVTQAADLAATNTPNAIPWNEIGAKAGVDYQGDGLAVTPTESGARLHCVFQRLDGEATPEGLWLTSTVTNMVSDRFRVTAMAVGRVADAALSPSDEERVAPKAFGGEGQFPCAGSVSVSGQTVRLSRPGLTEEYSVSMDGVRQDFVVEQAPLTPPGGELVVKLAVVGAEVELASDGARLVLDNSGRKIAYSRLRVTDATGKELPARIEVCPVEEELTSLNSSDLFGSDIKEESLLTSAPASGTLAVVVNDADAVYPVRIDPTFSDANWVSMGGVPGANGTVEAAVTDGSGNLYIGGEFTAAGNVIANYIAQWNGSSWSALGSGMDFYVHALAVSGGTLYAGGQFGTAGGSAANCIAQWDGTNWSALGSGISGSDPYGPSVYALAVSGGMLYVGGAFTTAGGSAANSIAQWNGSSWSPLGSGMNYIVSALAVSGGTLYAGGNFTTAGGSAANCIAQWNGTSWSPLGSGMNFGVEALAVSGSTLYAGGQFTTAGSNTASCIAQWNGTSWSPVGSGMNGAAGPVFVSALAVSGGTLYAGGLFTSAGGSSAINIAQWDGSTWSALGSGMYGAVSALAVSGGTLYAGGEFTTADGLDAFNYIAQWNSGWSPLGSGMNGGVFALAMSGSTLYAGGDFTMAGGSAANCIAQWNGSSWSALGSGMSGGRYGPYVLALAVSGGTLYAGGDFTTAGDDTNANYIAQWNGSSWSALGSGMNGAAGPVFVSALAVSGSTLFAGGYFTTAGGSAANYIAQWNGSSWSALGSGMNDIVLALAVSGNTLYAGGDFRTAGGNAANYIAQWNGSSWSALGSGMGGEDPPVLALAVSGDTLYAGGDFTTAGGSPAAGIAQWNGSSWSPLGSGVSGGYFPYVSTLAVSGSTLYAGGDFTTAGGNTANDIAQWNGSSWSPLGSGINGTVNALAVSGGTLYAGGADAVNYIVPSNVSMSGWSALGSGINGTVNALALSDSTLYAGGAFTTAGTSSVNYIAQWNGSSWSPLGSGLNSPVYALALSGSTLYAGGTFTNAGGSAANCVAQWNGTSWSALGSGISGGYYYAGFEYGPFVYALAVLGDTLYAGGYFTTAGGGAAMNIAQWNGSGWSPVGSGISGGNPDGYGPNVLALAVSGGTLYAGGEFTTAGGNVANDIAQWNGTSWTALGSGMGGDYPDVHALAVSGGTLYAGGEFRTAGGNAANCVAQWNGSSWSALGSGMGDNYPCVFALAVAGRTLYAGGYFTTADGSAANSIAQWNGTSWSALGSGMGGSGGYGCSVSALEVLGGTLYAGGNFTTAGTNVSAYVAMANLSGTPVSLAIVTTNAAFGFTNGAFGFDVTGPSGSNVVIQASIDLQTWIPLQTNLLGGGPLYFSDPQSSANVQRFYRAQLLP